MKKILSVFGTRPEAIKMCPLIQELNRRESFESLVCVTGQHQEMLKQVLDAFSVRPDFNLSVMRERQTLFDVTCGVLNGMNRVLSKVRPDLVLIHGDTTTAFASALSCFYRKIPVGHVEAGLRTYQIYSPFPEEFNREAVGLVAAYHFAPTDGARRNLLHEGKPSEAIFVTGNTAIDALQTTVKKDYKSPILDWIGDSKMILITAHRRENIGEPMRQMFQAIRSIVAEREDVKAVYPVHMNPAVREIAKDILGEEERIKLIEPLEVVDFHNLLARCYLVLTDSGGIQEEAPSLGKPVLVMRDTTERPEGLKAGTLKLTGTSRSGIYMELKRLLENEEDYRRMSLANNPYGDGRASVRIADILEKTM